MAQPQGRRPKDQGPRPKANDRRPKANGRMPKAVGPHHPSHIPNSEIRFLFLNISDYM